MALLENAPYAPPTFLKGKHLQTIAPAFRKVTDVPYLRERIDTPDGDFLDLDWLRQGHRKLLILTHGLEGNSQRPYILGMAKYFAQLGWDILAWNCRSCSGELNRLFRLYNHGDVGDISTVVNHATTRYIYDEVALAGFSMGGNINLKYAAVCPHPSVSKVIAFSAPLEMRSSTETLAAWDNWVYRYHFQRKLLPKLKAKAKLFPQKLDYDYVIKNIKSWDFQLHTFFCVMNDYVSLDDFYERGSALNFIADLKIKTLIVQAENDPMLSPACFPKDMARKHDFLNLEVVKQGGHCGFPLKNNKNESYAELRASAFLNNK
jgi:uncharacterized protein